jgi:hypothetical protein
MSRKSVVTTDKPEARRVAAVRAVLGITSRIVFYTAVVVCMLLTNYNIDCTIRLRHNSLTCLCQAKAQQTSHDEYVKKPVHQSNIPQHYRLNATLQLKGITKCIWNNF